MTEMVDIFYRGIQPELEDTLYEIVGRCLSRGQGRARRKLAAAEVNKIVEHIRKSFTDEIVRKYQRPLISAVEALPRQGLATMAEALVNLTALKLRMSVETVENVGGGVNVAVLSRGGWIYLDQTTQCPARDDIWPGKLRAMTRTAHPDRSRPGISLRAGCGGLSCAPTAPGCDRPDR
jgi:hypothetical protein